jgi:hypothetical protein
LQFHFGDSGESDGVILSLHRRDDAAEEARDDGFERSVPGTARPDHQLEARAGGPRRLRQSYLRIAKRAAMMAGRYAHAKQFKRHRRQLQLLRTLLGRLIRDISRKIAGNADLEAAFIRPLSSARQIRSQQQRQRGWKLYSFHAPEVE